MVFTSRIINISSEQQQEETVNYIEYLQSNGMQYIDTGVKGISTTKACTKVILDLSVEANSSGCGLFGARTGVQSNSFNIFNYSDNIRLDYRNNSYTSITRPTNSKIRIQIEKNGTLVVFQWNEEQLQMVTSQAFELRAFETPVNLYLFTINTNGEGYNPGAVAKLYSCQIYDLDGTTLIRDFKPARDSSGIDCLYDEVTKQYFYMQTIGSSTQPVTKTVEIGTLGSPDPSYIDENLVDEEVIQALNAVKDQPSSNTIQYNEICAWADVVTVFVIYFNIDTSLIPSNTPFSMTIKLRLCSARNYTDIDSEQPCIFGVQINTDGSQPSTPLSEEKLITNTSLYEEEFNFTYDQISSVNNLSSLAVALRVGRYGGYLSGGSVFITYDE